MFFNALTPRKGDCCGCSACINICPKTALSFQEDEEGFSIPVLDPSKCIECGMCERVCPMQHASEAVAVKEGTTFAAVNTDEDVLMHSSSGGVFSAIADHVLQSGGIVYGAAFDSNMRLKCIGIDNERDLEILRGSKYLQSENQTVYKIIRKQLQEGRTVYYCGTGCQVAGLKLFLRKEYENLLTTDILCHGTPSHVVFDEIINRLENKYHGVVRDYKFRDKKIWGWSCSSSSSIQKNGRTKYVGNEPLLDAYFNMFISGTMNRESCYVCPYAQAKRSGDITLGDFWGVENYLPIPNIRKGVSAIMVNSCKGGLLKESLKGRLKFHEAKLCDIAVVNETLKAPTPRPASRDGFYEKFRCNPKAVIGEYIKSNLRRTIVYHMKINPITRRMIDIIKNRR